MRYPLVLDLAADTRQEVDEGPYGDPQRRPGACLLPFKDDPLIVVERGGGVAVPGVQRGQGDAGNPVDKAAARGLSQGDRSLQVVPRLPWSANRLAALGSLP